MLIMLTKKLLSPAYVEKSELSPKLKAYADTMQYFLWVELCDLSPSFSQLFPWGENAVTLLQSYYDELTRYNWVNLIKIARKIHEITGDVKCPKELIIASCYRWVKNDYSKNKVICIYTSLDKNLLIVCKKSSDPCYACKVSQIQLNKELFRSNEHFYQCSFLIDQKFSVSMLKDINSYE